MPCSPRCSRAHCGVSSQRTYRMPKEVRVEPQKFAAELIHRLEAVQRTREAEEELEERLKRVRMVSGCRGAGHSGPLRPRPSPCSGGHLPASRTGQGSLLPPEGRWPAVLWRVWPASCSVPSLLRGAQMASLGQGSLRL